MVFVILLLGECQLLDPSLCAALRFLGLHQPSVLIIELGLKILQAVTMINCAQFGFGKKTFIFCSSLLVTLRPPWTASCSASSSFVCMSFTWRDNNYFRRRWFFLIYLEVEASPVLFSSLSIFLLSPELVRQTSSVNH